MDARPDVALVQAELERAANAMGRPYGALDSRMQEVCLRTDALCYCAQNMIRPSKHFSPPTVIPPRSGAGVAFYRRAGHPYLIIFGG